MLTDEQAPSWKKAMNSTQQNGGKEVQDSGWKKSKFIKMKEKKCARANKLLAEEKQGFQFNNKEENTCSRTNKLLAGQKAMNTS